MRIRIEILEQGQVALSRYAEWSAVATVDELRRWLRAIGRLLDVKVRCTIEPTPHVLVLLQISVTWDAEALTSEEIADKIDLLLDLSPGGEEDYEDWQ